MIASMPDEFEPISAKGGNGQIYFDGKQLKITRDGFAGRMTVGRAAKSIPLSSITAVRFRAAGFTTKGFVQFSVLGDLSVKGNLSSMNLEKDENSVIIHSPMQSLEVKKVVDAIESALANRSVPEQLSAPAVIQAVPTGSYLDDLLKLAELRDRGVFTEEEFIVEKTKLMNSQQQMASMSSNALENGGGYIWVLGFPKNYGVKTFFSIQKILGLPDGKDKSIDWDTYVPLIELGSYRNVYKKSHDPQRFNKLLSQKEADTILYELNQLGVSAELRQS